MRITPGIPPIWSSIEDPFELNYWLRVTADSQTATDGQVLTYVSSLVGPVAEVVTGSPIYGATSFAGGPGITCPYNPLAKLRQPLPSVFSPEKPFSLFFYTTLGTTETTKYLAGFGNAAGNPRCALFQNAATPEAASFVVLSTAQDVVPINSYQRLGAGNLYTGRRWTSGERALIGLIYDGLKWVATLNGIRTVSSVGYNYTTRTASAISHDNYLYFNGMAGLNYGSNPILKEWFLLDYAATDSEVAQYWRRVSARDEKRLFAIGDSITYGQLASTDAVVGTVNGWVQQLQDIDETRVCTNWGKVGDTTTQMRQHLETALRRYLPGDARNTTITIFGGTNDLIATTLTAAQIYDNIGQINTLAKSYGCGKSVIATIPTSTNIVGSRETQRQALNALIVQNAIGATAICDVASLVIEKSDGTHPTTTGHNAIAIAFNNTLSEIGF